MSRQSDLVDPELEEKLVKALDEAWEKTNKAIALAVEGSVDTKMPTWLAAEAMEYSSALFSLTYDLVDVNPQVVLNQREDPMVLMKKSLELLRSARELRTKSIIQAYAALRQAADNFKIVYLGKIKRPSRKTR